MHQFLIKNIKNFSVAGFTFKPGTMAFTWTKDEKNRKLRIVLPYNKVNDGIELHFMIAEIYFSKVEEAYSLLKKKFQDLDALGEKATVTKVFVDNEYFNTNPKHNNVVIGQSDFENFKEQFGEAFYHQIVPFFSYYNSLEKASDLYAGLSLEETVPYIQGPLLFLKSILCLKLSNHPNYIKKRDEYLGILEIYSSKKEAYKNVLNAYTDVFSNK